MIEAPIYYYETQKIDWQGEKDFRLGAGKLLDQRQHQNRTGDLSPTDSRFALSPGEAPALSPDSPEQRRE